MKRYVLMIILFIFLGGIVSAVYDCSGYVYCCSGLEERIGDLEQKVYYLENKATWFESTINKILDYFTFMPYLIKKQVLCNALEETGENQIQGLGLSCEIKQVGRREMCFCK